MRGQTVSADSCGKEAQGSPACTDPSHEGFPLSSSKPWEGCSRTPPPSPPHLDFLPSSLTLPLHIPYLVQAFILPPFIRTVPTLFRSVRANLKRCCKSAVLNMPANLENSAVATGLEKVSFHSNPKEGQCSNYHTIALISHASKVMLKILQVRLQQYVNRKLSDVQAGFRKAKEPEIKLPTSVGS